MKHLKKFNESKSDLVVPINRNSYNKYGQNIIRITTRTINIVKSNLNLNKNVFYDNGPLVGCHEISIRYYEKTQDYIATLLRIIELEDEYYLVVDSTPDVKGSYQSNIWYLLDGTEGLTEYIEMINKKMELYYSNETFKKV